MFKSKNHEHIHDLADMVRRLHDKLRHTADTLHADLKVSSPKRTLLMELYRHAALTVPSMASSRCLSRQIVQTQINELLAAGYVAPQENPEHKRSSLYVLTKAGCRLVEEMIERESVIIDGIDWFPEENDLNTCSRVLTGIYEHLPRV